MPSILFGPLVNLLRKNKILVLINEKTCRDVRPLSVGSSWMNVLRTFFLCLLLYVLWTSAVPAMEVCPDRNPRDEILTEAVVYLQKSTIALKKENNPQSLNRRVTPIITVLSGLLDAGFTHEEPIVLSAAEFIETFYSDYKRYCNRQLKSGNLSADEQALLVQLRKCLKKIRSAQSLKPLHGKQPLSQTPCSETERDVVISPGFGSFTRVRDTAQPSFKALPENVSHWGNFQYKILIASVHALPEYFPLTPPFQKPQDTKSFFVPKFAMRTPGLRDVHIVVLCSFIFYLELFSADCFVCEQSATENPRLEKFLCDLGTTRLQN